jgi:hypothetical protein
LGCDIRHAPILGVASGESPFGDEDTPEEDIP